MIFNEDELPQDAESLKNLVLDLSRRLQNAQHTIDAERRISAQAQRQAEYFRNRLEEVVRTFRLEGARLRNLDLKMTLQTESQKYEDNKTKGTALHEQLRMLELDHTMTGNRHFVPVKLQRMRTQAKQLEVQQESRRQALQHLNDQIQLQEALTNAIAQQQVAQVVQLLRQGGDVNFVDSAGYLPLHHACVFGAYSVAEVLLEWGSDHSAFLTGIVPIVMAAQHGHVNVVRLLLDYGANPEEVGKSGSPALHAALQQGHFSVVDFLLQQGAQVNSRDRYENTPLHLATEVHEDYLVGVLQLLCSNGAALDTRNKNEDRPIDMALRHGRRQAYEWLKEMEDQQRNNKSRPQSAPHDLVGTGQFPFSIPSTAAADGLPPRTAFTPDPYAADVLNVKPMRRGLAEVHAMTAPLPPTSAHPMRTQDTAQEGLDALLDAMDPHAMTAKLTSSMNNNGNTRLRPPRHAATASSTTGATVKATAGTTRVNALAATRTAVTPKPAGVSSTSAKQVPPLQPQTPSSPVTGKKPPPVTTTTTAAAQSPNNKKTLKTSASAGVLLGTVESPPTEGKATTTIPRRQAMQTQPKHSAHTDTTAAEPPSQAAIVHVHESAAVGETAFDEEEDAGREEGVAETMRRGEGRHPLQAASVNSSVTFENSAEGST